MVLLKDLKLALYSSYYTSTIYQTLSDAYQEYLPTTSCSLLSDPTFSNLIDNMNKELEKLSDWCKANKLFVNHAKSNAMVIPPKQCVSHNDIALKHNNKPILLTNKFEYLGVTLDSKLDFHAHIELIENKISRSIGIICKMRNFFPRDILLKLYYSLVHPLLLHGLFVWGSTFKT